MFVGLIWCFGCGWVVLLLLFILDKLLLLDYVGGVIGCLLVSLLRLVGAVFRLMCVVCCKFVWWVFGGLLVGLLLSFFWLIW